MMELNSFQRCPLGRTKGNEQILKQEVPDEPQERFVSERVTEHCHRLLRSCGITNLEELQKKSGHSHGQVAGKAALGSPDSAMLLDQKVSTGPQSINCSVISGRFPTTDTSYTTRSFCSGNHPVLKP